jgi:hypothetical protein
VLRTGNIDEETHILQQHWTREFGTADNVDQNSYITKLAKIVTFIKTTPKVITFQQFQQHKLTVKTLITWLQNHLRKIDKPTQNLTPTTKNLKQIYLFTIGLTMIHALEHQMFKQATHKLLNTKLAKLNISTTTYTWWRFVNKNIVYAKISTKTNHMYIGMTTKGILHREQSRKRKFVQLQRGRFVSCEPALRFWKHSKTFHQYFPIVIATTQTKPHALASESYFIETFQPSLNMPFIQKYFLENTIGSKKAFSFPETKYKQQFKKLWKKVRRRAFMKKQLWRERQIMRVSGPDYASITSAGAGAQCGV